MPFHGSIVVIKRSGFDGSVFPLVNGDCVMGRAEGCDIRVQLPTVSEEHCRIETNENDEARLVCLSENAGQTQLNGKIMKTGTSEVLYHKTVFTVGDRSFRWEYPQDSAHVSRKPEGTQRSPRKSPKPKVLTPNNSQGKDSTPKHSNEAMAVASKAIEAAITAVIPSPQPLKTPKQAVINRVSSSKRVSFGPYISPEIIDKTLPPSTPVKRGAAPLNLSLDINASKTINSPKTITGNATPRTIDTPSALIKRNLKKKISKYPANESITEETKPGVLKRNPNDTPMIKDNSGYRASPRRTDAVAENTPKIRRSSIQQKMSIKTNEIVELKQKTPPAKLLSPAQKNKAIPKLTKSTVKIRPTKSFYGTKAAQTPKGAKRKVSLVDDVIPSAKKARKTSPAKIKTPEKSTTKARMLKVTKSTVKVKQSNIFYGTNAAKTPKGARPSKRFASPIQRVAKKTRLSTPKGCGKPELLKKDKAKTPKVATPSKTPGSGKIKRKPMWSEIVKKVGQKKATMPTKANQAQRIMKRVKRVSKVQPPLQLEKINKGSSLTTGHAKSPETIVIKRKVKAKTPKVLAKVGRKTPSKVKATPARKATLSLRLSAEKSTANIAIATSSTVAESRTLKAIVSPRSSLKSTPNSNKLTTPTLPGVKTPKTNATPKSTTKSTPSKIETPNTLKHMTPQSASLTYSEQPEHTPSLNETAFDFDSIKTPAIPLEMFVSPLTSKKKSPKRLSQGKTPDLSGIKMLMASPKEEKTPRMGGIKQMLATPKNVKTPNMRGIRKMMISPKPQKTPRMAGIKQMFASPKNTRTPDMRGIKAMMVSPKSQKTPRFGVMKQMFTTPKDAKTPDMSGIKEMLKTPKSLKSPRTGGIKQMFISPKEAKTPRMAGMQQMFATPKSPVTPSFEGLSSLVKTPTPKKISPAKQSVDASASKATDKMRCSSSTKILSPKLANSPKEENLPSPPTKRPIRGRENKIIKSPTKVGKKVQTPEKASLETKTSPVKRTSRRRNADINSPTKSPKTTSAKTVASPLAKRVSRRRGNASANSPTTSNKDTQISSSPKNTLRATKLVECMEKQGVASPVKRVSRRKAAVKVTPNSPKKVSSPEKPSTNEQIVDSTLVQKNNRRKATSTTLIPNESPEKADTKKKSPPKRVSRRKGIVAEVCSNKSPPKTGTPRASKRKTVATSPNLPKQATSQALVSPKLKKSGTPRVSKRKVVIVTPGMSNKVVPTLESLEITDKQLTVASSPTKSSRKVKKVVSKPSLKTTKAAEAESLPSQTPEKLVTRRKRAAAANIGSMKELAGNKKLRRGDLITSPSSDPSPAKDKKKTVSSKATETKTRKSKKITSAEKKTSPLKSIKPKKEKISESPKKTPKTKRVVKKAETPSPPKRVTRSRR